MNSENSDYKGRRIQTPQEKKKRSREKEHRDNFDEDEFSSKHSTHRKVVDHQHPRQHHKQDWMEEED